MEKCAELGASTLIPLLTERSAAVGRAGAGGAGGSAGGNGKKDNKKRRNGGGGGGGFVADDDDDGEEEYGKTGREGRWERVAAAASKQCLRTHHLHITPPMPFAALVEQVAAAPVSLLAAAGAPPLQEVLQQQHQTAAADVDNDDAYAGGGILIVGPEVRLYSILSCQHPIILTVCS